MRTQKAILISIRPNYAIKILNGEKTVELRKVCPQLDEGDLCLIYASSPLKSLVGVFKVKYTAIFKPKEYWPEIQNCAGINYQDYMSYFKNCKKGYAFFIDKVWKFPDYIELHNLREIIPGFNPPQNFRYLNSFTKDELKSLDRIYNVFSDCQINSLLL
ncbi:MAG: hypothetical protein ACOX1X_00285 [Dethiobacteria bacterium]